MTLLKRWRDWLRARLIDDAGKWWRMWSVRLNGLGLLLLSASQILSESWSTMPPDLRAALPYANVISIVLFASGLLARVVVQKKLGKSDGE